MKKKEKMIRNFEAISKYDIYSKYNVILEKKFKDKSLKSFIYSLKNPKKKEKLQFLDEFYKKYPYDFEDKKIVEVENEDFLKIDDPKKDDDQKLNSPKNIKTELRSSFSTKRYIEPEFPDPFKYHPNYDSIYKKIRTFKISPIKNNIKNLKRLKGLKNIFNNPNQFKKKNNLETNDNNLSDIDEEKKNIKSIKVFPNNNSYKILTEQNYNNFGKSNINSLNFKDKEKNLDLPLITTTNIIDSTKKENHKNNIYNTIETSYSRDNHALRFSKYLPRKNMFEGANNQVSYIEPYNYNNDPKKTIDFSKMKSRTDKNIIYSSSLDMPPLGKYYPKYTLVENNPKNIIFSPFGENQNIKKNILQKMKGSYKVLSEYKTIDNTKLFNDQDIINKQLILNYNLDI